MYMDDHQIRHARSCADSELLHRILAEGSTHRSPYRGGGNVRGCDGNLRPTDCRGNALARAEQSVTDSCGCDGESTGNGNRYPCGENGVEGRSLAIVYAPIQSWRDAYEPQTALQRGTLFRELDLPFDGKGPVGKGGNCRGC